MRSAEREDLIEELDVAGLEGNEKFGVSVGLDEGLADLRDDYEVILLYAGDADGFPDDGRGEAFSDEGRYEGHILVLEAEAVGEDVDAASDVEVAILRWEGFRRRAICLCMQRLAQ
ncbi:hypothetical protein LR48_Vigan03g079000 [Vigna angularis]|uniref:Uncharacterized protein n=1 Tax=Phaseolus angularis TaxID=3914 RepID=A0A0L9U3K8_PHAAN|nr:hypothetical protein LR48_Vigan03g079000 [Vigna angularis]